MANVNFYHKKSLGQNFSSIIKKYLKKISKINCLKNKHVIEIGPGKGSLTNFYLKKILKVLTAIEKDEKLKPFLEKIKLNDHKNFNFI